VSQEQHQTDVPPVNTPVWSDNDSCPEESGKKEGRQFWSEEENLRLVSAWLKHSTDPIVGVDRRGDRYWKDVAAEYNLTTPKDRRKTGAQLKNHWTKTIPLITIFNACYEKEKREHASGESDDQVMKRAWISDEKEKREHATYLRKPTTEDIQRLLHIGEARGFPGMLGSVDCMHWQWRNCPVAWKGQYTRGDQCGPTVMLEAVASHDLWIWHAFFGVAGSNNDINVLNRSPLFTDVVQGRAPEVHFTVNGNEYNMGYYLADGNICENNSFASVWKRQIICRTPRGSKKRCGTCFWCFASSICHSTKPSTYVASAITR